MTLTDAATIAPIKAIPSEPPTWRMLFSTAEPTPALSTGTEPMAAAVVGVIASDMPKPPSTSPEYPDQFVEGYHNALHVAAAIAIVGAIVAVATVRKVHHPEAEAQPALEGA